MPLAGSPLGLGLGSLGSILGGIGQGAVQADVLGQHQRALDLTQRSQDLQNEARTTDIAPLFQALGLQLPAGGGRVATPIAGELAKIGEARRLQDIEQQRRGQLAQTVNGLAATNPRAAEIGPLLESGAITPADLMKHLFPQSEFAAAAPGSTLYSKQTGLPPAGFTPPEQPGPLAFDPNTQRRTLTRDKNTGAVQESVTDLAPSEERTRIDEARRRFPNDPGAQVKWLNDLAAQRAAGIAGAQNAVRPPTDQEQLAMQNFNQILGALQQMKQYTPEEMAKYVGLLQRPGQEAKMALQGLPVIGGAFGQPDQRFADFKALMGRLQGTAFGEGGKQLTPFEATVVFSYTPTGREPGGPPEIMAKLRNLEAFTKMARATRAELARTGKNAVLDPDVLDDMLKRNMQATGLGSPNSPNAPPSPAIGNQNPPETKGAPVWQLRETATGRMRRYQPGPGEMQPPAGYERVQ